MDRLHGSCIDLRPSNTCRIYSGRSTTVGQYNSRSPDTHGQLVTDVAVVRKQLASMQCSSGCAGVTRWLPRACSPVVGRPVRRDGRWSMDGRHAASLSFVRMRAYIIYRYYCTV